jgi:mono/diheme cytochrome c family protein
MVSRSPALAGLLLSAVLGAGAPQSAGAVGDAKRGEYLSKAGGCLGCHTASKQGSTPYAGGRELETAFGVFYGPNITPDPSAGIGRWSEADFVRAMRQGVRPDGSHYYPAFPYTSFTKISDADLTDLWAYLRSLPPSAVPSQSHELRFPFGFRFLVWGWKWLYFKPGAFQADAARKAAVNRGAYLTDALGHCGECHTPRNFLGGPRRGRYMAGSKLTDGASASNLTPTRLKTLSDGELADLLKFGQTPDGDVLGETMDEVVRNTTSQLKPEDLAALIAYLRSIPPLPDEPK